MKNTKIDTLLQEGKIDATHINAVDLVALKIRKKVAIFSCEIKEEEALVVFSNAKSRILSKQIDALDDILAKVSKHLGKNAKQKILFYVAPICSKALKYAQNNNWRLLHVPN